MIQPRQIFVVGSSRSGTTMMGRILGAHSAINTFSELHFFEQLWDPTIQSGQLSAEEAIELGARLLAIQRDGYYNQGDSQLYRDEAAGFTRSLASPVTPPAVFSAMLNYETGQTGKLIPCDQTPRNVFYLQEILRLFPNAYIVHMIRDPRDVLLSQKKKWRRRSLGGSRIPRWQTLRFWANYHPITMSLLWNSAIRAANLLGSHPRVREVRFEDLVSDPEREVCQLCQFLGLTYQPTMLHVPKVGSSHRVDERTLGIDSSSAGRWRQAENDVTDLIICEWLCRKSMAQYGYGPSGWLPSWLGVVWAGFTWLPKMVVAFILNVGRTRSAIVAIRRRLPGMMRSSSASHRTAR